MQTSQFIWKQTGRVSPAPVTRWRVSGTVISDAFRPMPNDTTTMTKEKSPNSRAGRLGRKISEATKCAPDTATGPAAEAP